MTEPMNSPAGQAGYYLHTYSPKVPNGPCERCGLEAAAIPHARPVSRYPLPVLLMVGGVGLGLLVVLAAVGFLFHRENDDRAARRTVVNSALAQQHADLAQQHADLAQQHADLCSFLADVPLSPDETAFLHAFETRVGCPLTAPRPLPTVTVVPATPSTLSTAPAGHATTGAAAGVAPTASPVVGSAPALTAPTSTRPDRGTTRPSTPRPTPTPTTPALACVLQVCIP